MSQQKKLEKVLDLLINEDTATASDLLHQIIVEKARSIYENIVNEEDMEDDIEDDIEDDSDEDKDMESGDASDDFTADIEVDKDDIDSDELNDGESGEDFDLEVDADAGDDRIDDLEDQLAQLRAEFDALLSDEMKEPEHADLDVDADLDMDMDDSEAEDFGGDDFGSDDVEDTDFLTNSMFEGKLKKFAKEMKDAKDKKAAKAKVDEETQFLSKVADTGQHSTSPGFAGTGKHTPKGAEQTKSQFTNAPAKPSYGGKPVAMGKGTGGEPGKYNAGEGKNETPKNNGKPVTKSVAKTDDSDKWSGTGKESGNFGSQQKKSPLSKSPKKST